ncbi:MAG: hypothetical protein PHY64_09910, partial [Eubacteriales bacterium]|nr:hypothetical protein [Eubacteriales bacterium]
KRKWLAALCLLMVAALLTGCTGQQQNNQVFDEVTQYLGPTPTATPVAVNTEPTGVSDGSTTGGDSVFSSNPYMAGSSSDFTETDALGEEDTQDTGVYDDGTVAYGQADAEATLYPYAGSSPIPLDPVDAPTPTPRPQLSFTYVTYDVPQLGLTVDGPAGWVPDDSVNEMYTLTEPEAQIKEGQLGVLTLCAVPVSNNYTESALVTEVKQRLDTISSSNFIEWKPSYTATRYLMGSKGVYANYSGTLADGTQVGGRIHAVTINKVLYCLQITYPLGYKDDYLNIFAKARETIKRTGN